MTLCLGIESTAHTFGAAVLKNKKVLSNVRDTFTTESGGMIPAKVADHHVELCDALVQEALKEANVSITDISLISYSRAPGIGHMLRIGCSVAKSLALHHSIPIIGVNHCIAHLEIGRMKSKAKDPILVYASGANTQIIAYEANKYRIFGETLDMGIGNFLDSFARHAGLGFPGGPKIDALAKKSTEFIQLPYCVKGMDLTFGGILSNLKQKLAKGEKLESLCFSLQETVFAMLCETAERALAHTGKKEIILGGGVACNKRLQTMMTQMCEQRGAICYLMENEFYVDNAAMIAWLGILMQTAQKLPTVRKTTIDPYERTDDVKVTWR
ncbi:MAG: universal protein Kae1 [Candidatus Woesearchaeota archaeon]|jgi:universal protein Kae1